MQVKWLIFLCVFVVSLSCKTQREPVLILQPLNESPEIESPPESPSQAKPVAVPNAVPTASPQPVASSDAPVDLCATRPDLYQMKDGKCVLSPLPSVEGDLNISSGVLWKPDLSRCKSPGFGGGFRFCSGGVHASIPLALPAQGNGKVRFTISFNCKSFPAQNSIELSIGNEIKVTLASVTVDTPIFSNEIAVEAGVAKNVRLDFTPNYSADYPATCLLYLIENRIL